MEVNGEYGQVVSDPSLRPSAPFPDDLLSVPPVLRDRLAEAYKRFGADAEGCAYALAIRVMRHYLGDKWVDERAVLSDEPDPFMLNERDGASENRWIHQDRVIQLGDALFTLGDATNAEVLYQRFRQRDSRPCFLEATTAETFLEYGFRIEIVRESGRRGEDFDFVARKAGICLNVEVTGTTSTDLTKKVIQNVLNNKRDQVPADGPAALFVIIPEAWTVDSPAAEAAVGGATNDFFRGSKRINAVVFVWDVIIPIGTSRLFAVTQLPYFHPAPRHSTAGLKWLRRAHPIGDLANVRALAEAREHDALRWHASADDGLSKILRWAKAASTNRRG